MQAERDQENAARKKIAAERDQESAARKKISAERDHLAEQNVIVTAQRDNLAKENELVTFERDLLAEENKLVSTERDDLVVEINLLKQEQQQSVVLRQQRVRRRRPVSAGPVVHLRTTTIPYAAVKRLLPPTPSPALFLGVPPFEATLSQGVSCTVHNTQ